MRNKALGINVRVTPAEKEKIAENANYCGLSLSEYLRNVGLGKEVKATLDEQNYNVFKLLRRLKKDLPMMNQGEIFRCIEEVERLIDRKN